MNALQPLMALLEQTERERDAALAEHQRAAAAQQAAAAQCEQLLGYRGEYEQRWGERFGREGGMELMHCYQGFMQRLAQAVEQQERVARHAMAQFERTREALLRHEIRVASVRKLIERRVREAQQSADRREQRQADEFASRLIWTRHAAQVSAQPA